VAADLYQSLLSSKAGLPSRPPQIVRQAIIGGRERNIGRVQKILGDLLSVIVFPVKTGVTEKDRTGSDENQAPAD